MMLRLAGFTCLSTVVTVVCTDAISSMTSIAGFNLLDSSAKVRLGLVEWGYGSATATLCQFWAPSATGLLPIGNRAAGPRPTRRAPAGPRRQPARAPSYSARRDCGRGLSRRRGFLGYLPPEHGPARRLNRVRPRPNQELAPLQTSGPIRLAAPSIDCAYARCCSCRSAAAVPAKHTRTGLSKTPH
jgi:hypothetical protein